MKIAVISDLHLGARDAADRFSLDAETFRQWVSALLDAHELLVLGGDVFDVAAIDPRAYGGVWQTYQRLWPDVLDVLAHPRVRWIVGNNDMVLSRRGVAERFEIVSGGHRLCVIHGHQFVDDPEILLDAKRVVRRLALRAQRRSATRALGNAAFAFNEVFGARRNDEGAVGAGARDMLARGHADVVVCGHTHAPVVEEGPHGIYANSGACSSGRVDWLSIDLTGPVVELRHEARV